MGVALVYIHQIRRPTNIKKSLWLFTGLENSKLSRPAIHS
nr:MAG TPA: hypothetical protein [Caudoviricetes sp.]DAU24930.1 MAG TPA: hypothetical protein [Caudoviricetes sp.]